MYCGLFASVYCLLSVTLSFSLSLSNARSIILDVIPSLSLSLYFFRFFSISLSNARCITSRCDWLFVDLLPNFSLIDLSNLCGGISHELPSHVARKAGRKRAGSSRGYAHAIRELVRVIWSEIPMTLFRHREAWLRAS